MIKINIAGAKRVLAYTGLAAAMVLSFVANADHHGIIKAAIEHPDRPKQDKSRDVNRKPGEVLLFAGVKPGMTVLDLNSGGGYYSEILSHAVGSEGKVIAHNGTVYWTFMNKTVPARFTERLSNVEPLNVESEVVDLPENSVDLVMSVLAYHDYFFNHESRKAPEDMPMVLASIYRSMKPGGSFVVVDHEALDGTGSEVGDTLHRINSDFVKNQVLAAGFKLDAESEALANPEDAKTQSVFHPDIRGKTDRFVIRFTK